MAWACDRCDTLHTRNPKQCRSCGFSRFRPVSDSELRDRSSGGESPASLSPDEIGSAGSAPDTDSVGTKSPDVAVDGSVKGDSSQSESGNESSSGFWERIRNLFS